MTVGPEPRAPRYRALDTWRGLACLMVVLYHATFRAPDTPASAGIAAAVVATTRWLFLGVPFFFVISGYCIAASADTARRRPDGIATYFRRRVQRIFPAFWATLAVTVAMVALVDACAPGLVTNGPSGFPRPATLTLGQWIGNLTLTEAWRHYVIGAESRWFINPAWTLAYEEQFYAITGLIVLLAPQYLFTAAAGITVFTLAVRALFPGPLHGVFVDGTWLQFAAGIVVYHRQNYATRAMAWGDLALLGLGLVWAFSLGATDFWAGLFRLHSLAAFGFAIALALLHRWDAMLASAVILKPLRFFGRLCYALYLVHWPIVKLLGEGLARAGITSTGATLAITVPLCLATATAAAWLLHRTIETRFWHPSGAVD